MIEQATGLLLERESYAFENLWDSLTRNARRLLKGVAVSEPGIQVFSAEFIRKHRLGSSSNAQRAIDLLKTLRMHSPESTSRPVRVCN